MFQAGICNGDQLGTRLEDGRGVDVFEHFILTIRNQKGRKPANHRLALDEIFQIARTGSPWRDQPEEFGKWSSVYRQFRRWTLAGLERTSWIEPPPLNWSALKKRHGLSPLTVHKSTYKNAINPLKLSY